MIGNMSAWAYNMAENDEQKQVDWYPKFDTLVSDCPNAFFCDCDVKISTISSQETNILILWMEEILHHLGWLKPYK